MTFGHLFWTKTKNLETPSFVPKISLNYQKSHLMLLSFKGTGIFKEKGLFGNAAQETENNLGA